ncbi:MAG: acyl-CoA thioesterase [Symbiobacterium sp.]|uniref:acyl-CoA thioesterase n=1 Tax=Symbiobacterium sp. TaxID=1971213 RepID=UPI00346489D6
MRGATAQPAAAIAAHYGMMKRKRGEIGPMYQVNPSLQPKPSRLSACEMTELVMPNDANPMGNMLGGRLLHLMDVAAGIAAMRHAGRPCVTACFDSVDFLTPVHIGEVCILKARVTWTGRTSLEVQVDVYCESPTVGERRHTTTAFACFVALDPETGKPAPVPPLLLETEEERQAFAEAEERRRLRLARRGSTC